MAVRPELPTAIVRYPASPTHPLRVGFEAVEIEVAIASRDALAKFDGMEEYRVPGIYVLLGHADHPHQRTVRPGEAWKQTLDARLRFHLGIDSRATGMAERTLLGWDAAALCRRVGGEFSRDETGVLETLLHDRLDSAVFVRRVGKKSNYEHPRDQRDLEQRVLPALLIGLRLAGLDIRTQADLDAVAQTAAKHRPDEGGTT